MVVAVAVAVVRVDFVAVAAVAAVVGVVAVAVADTVMGVAAAVADVVAVAVLLLLRFFCAAVAAAVVVVAQVFEALTKRTRGDTVATKLTRVKDSALARRIWVDKVWRKPCSLMNCSN